MSKRTPIKWTSPNVMQIVSEEVQKSPGNLSNAFRQISVRMNSTESAVTQAWYKTLRNKFSQFHTGSNQVVLSNTKNVPRKGNNNPIHEKILSSAVYDGMRVVTIKQYYAV